VDWTNHRIVKLDTSQLAYAAVLLLTVVIISDYCVPSPMAIWAKWTLTNQLLDSHGKLQIYTEG